MNKWLNPFSALLWCLSTNAIADNESISLPNMTIYNDSITPKIESSMKNELNREDLEVSEMPDLNSVLRNQSSVTLNQGSGQMNTAIILKGAGGAGQGMVTLDGVPLFGNFAGFYSLSHYSLDALDKVTVSSGVGGERHGSRSLGGAIHLQTRKMTEKDTFLHVEGGSYDTVRGAVGSGLTTDAGDFSVVVGRSDVFNGISQAKTGIERDDFGLTHASGNWLKTFERGKLNASLYFVRSDEDIDGPGFAPGRHTISWVDDKRGKLSEETWVSQLQGDYDLANYWNTSLQLGFTQDRQKMVSTLIKPFALTNQLLMADWKNTHRLPLDENTKNQALFAWGVNTQHQQSLGIHSAQTVISPNVRGELNIDSWQLSADGRFDVGDVYGNHQVFSLGINRALTQTVNIFANGGTGYRQPGVSELMHPVFGNKALKGESSAGGEIGFDWKPLPQSGIKVSGYHHNYKQMITLQLDSKTGLIKAANVEEADVWGAEMQARHRWTSILESGLTYTYVNAINPVTHLHVAGRPEQQGTFWSEVKIAQPLKLRMEFTMHGNYWFDAANMAKANTAPRVNALLEYQLIPKTILYLRGENITDNRTSELNDMGFNGAAVYAGFRTGF